MHLKQKTPMLPLLAPSALRILLSLSIITFLCAQTAAAELKFCTESEDSYPWILKNRKGLSIILLEMVEKKINQKILIDAIPWKRCLQELKIGHYDGAVNASFKIDRAEFAAYPMTADKVDTNKRMLIDSYSLYRLKGSKIEWDGKVFKPQDAIIGAQTGFSVVDQLKSLNLKVDDSNGSTEINLKKLLLGRVSAVALPTLQGDNVLDKDAELQSKIEKIELPLIEKPYYLIFSKPFFAQETALVKKIWDNIESARESVEYKKQMDQFK
jgi:polar amino acid transport system substrate-binding protein